MGICSVLFLISHCGLAGSDVIAQLVPGFIYINCVERKDDTHIQYVL